MIMITKLIHVTLFSCVYIIHTYKNTRIQKTLQAKVMYTTNIIKRY